MGRRGRRRDVPSGPSPDAHSCGSLAPANSPWEDRNGLTSSQGRWFNREDSNSRRRCTFGRCQGKTARLASGELLREGGCCRASAPPSRSAYRCFAGAGVFPAGSDWGATGPRVGPSMVERKKTAPQLGIGKIGVGGGVSWECGYRRGWSVFRCGEDRSLKRTLHCIAPALRNCECGARTGQ